MRGWRAHIAAGERSGSELGLGVRAPIDAKVVAHAARTRLRRVDREALALALEDAEVLEVDVADAVHRARVDGLGDDVRIVAALQKGTRTSGVLLDEERVARHLRAVLAADAIELLNVDKAQECRLTILVLLDLEVRCNGLIGLGGVRCCFYAAKQRADQPRI